MPYFKETKFIFQWQMDESKAKFQNKLLKFYENKDYNDIVTTSSYEEMLLSNKCDEGGK